MKGPFFSFHLSQSLFTPTDSLTWLDGSSGSRSELLERHPFMKGGFPIFKQPFISISLQKTNPKRHDFGTTFHCLGQQK